MKDFSKIKYYIYCSGKTGSKTLYHGFSKKFGPEKCLHIHTERQINIVLNESINIKNFITESSKNNDKVFIIDSYREPFERSISSFFENLHTTNPNWKSYRNERLINLYNASHLKTIELYHSYLESWKMFDISTDINFDFEKGFVSKTLDNIVFVKVRLKDSNKWPLIFEEITGEKINFEKNNDSSTKNYNSGYNKFKISYELPKDVKDTFLKFYTQKYKVYENNLFYPTWLEMKKFMTNKEIEDYLLKWKII